jgi:hypothetical protein
MKSSLQSLRSSFAALALAALGLSFVQNASAAQSSTPSGPVVIPGGIVTTTYVISAPGSYVLAGNRTMNDFTKYAIEIKAPDVTLDLGGFTLAHSTAAGPSQVATVNIPATENVEIRNGTIADAPYVGIYANSGKTIRVIGVRIVSARNIGIVAYAQAPLIDRCHITDATHGIVLSASNQLGLITDSVISGCINTGVSMGGAGRIVRLVVQGAATGIIAGVGASVSDSTVMGTTQVGIIAQGATLRNVDVVNNVKGVHCQPNSVNVFAGCRITNNTTQVYGNYINAGGNVIQ